MSDGYYLMHRGWMESEVFKGEPYTEREAWEWMISEAIYDNYEANILGRPVILKRGQLSHSLRFLSEKWGWSKSRVERFIEKLIKWQMIETVSSHGQNIVTICKYDKYQSPWNGPQEEIETGPGQDRDRTGTKTNTDNKDNTETPYSPPKKKPRRNTQVVTLDDIRSHPLDGEVEQWFAEHAPDVNRFRLRVDLVLYVEETGKEYTNHLLALKRWASKRQDQIEQQKGKTDGKLDPFQQAARLIEERSRKADSAGAAQAPDDPGLPTPDIAG